MPFHSGGVGAQIGELLPVGTPTVDPAGIASLRPRAHQRGRGRPQVDQVESPRCPEVAAGGDDVGDTRRAYEAEVRATTETAARDRVLDDGDLAHGDPQPSA